MRFKYRLISRPLWSRLTGIRYSWSLLQDWFWRNMSVRKSFGVPRRWWHYVVKLSLLIFSWKANYYTKDMHTRSFWTCTSGTRAESKFESISEKIIWLISITKVSALKWRFITVILIKVVNTVIYKETLITIRIITTLTSISKEF